MSILFRKAHTIDLDAIELFQNTEATIKYIKAHKTISNYLDFQIVTLTGLLLGKNSEEKIAIISNDKGYIAVIDYLKTDCVTNTNRIIELAGTIEDVKQSNRKIDNSGLKENINVYITGNKNIKNIIKKSTSKGALKMNLIAEFGRIDGLEIYTKLEKDFRPKRKKY